MGDFFIRLFRLMLKVEKTVSRAYIFTA